MCESEIDERGSLDKDISYPANEIVRFASVEFILHRETELRAGGTAPVKIKMTKMKSCGDFTKLL